MCHRLFLLAIYTVLASAILRVYNSIIWAPSLVSPAVINARNLKAILDNRGVLYPGVVEKQELVGMVEASGVVHSNEEEFDIRPGPEDNLADIIHMFRGSDHFYEQVEDCKDSAWLVHVMTPNSKPIFGTGPWRGLVDRLDSFGVRSGVFDCRLDTYLCLQRGWNTSRLLLAMPHAEAPAKGSVVMQTFGGPINPVRVQRWVYQKLADRVHRSDSPREMSRWLNESCSVTDVCVLLVSSLTLPPVFLSALSVKFTGRLSFGMAPSDVVEEVLGGGGTPEDQDSDQERQTSAEHHQESSRVKPPAQQESKQKLSPPSPSQHQSNEGSRPTTTGSFGTNDNTIISTNDKTPIAGEPRTGGGSQKAVQGPPAGTSSNVETLKSPSKSGANAVTGGDVLETRRAGPSQLVRKTAGAGTPASDRLLRSEDSQTGQVGPGTQRVEEGSGSDIQIIDHQIAPTSRQPESPRDTSPPSSAFARHRLVATPTPSARTGRYYWLARTENYVRTDSAMGDSHAPTVGNGDFTPDDAVPVVHQPASTWHRVEYGMRHPAERASYPAFLDFLQWLFPDGNDFFILTLAVANMCAVMALFEFRSGSPVTHMLRFLWALLKYNFLLLVGWLLVLTLGQLPSAVRAADSVRTLLLRVTLTDVALTLRGDWRSMSTRLVIGSYLAYCSLIGWMRRRWWPFSSFSDDGLGEQSWTEWLISYGRGRPRGIDDRTLTEDERHILLFLRRQYDTPGAYLTMSENPSSATQETLRLISQLPVWKFHAVPAACAASSYSAGEGRQQRSGTLCVRCKLVKNMKLRRLAQRFSRRPCAKCGYDGQIYNPLATLVPSGSHNTMTNAQVRHHTTTTSANSRHASSSSTTTTSVFHSIFGSRDMHRNTTSTGTSSSHNHQNNNFDSLMDVDWSNFPSNQRRADSSSSSRSPARGSLSAAPDNQHSHNHQDSFDYRPPTADDNSGGRSPASHGAATAGGGSESEYGDCRICLEPYRDGEDLCGLPCDHGYHRKCILPWLLSGQHVCPLCRGAAFPKA